MKSFQEDFYLDSGNLARRAWRNVKLLGYALQLVWFWAIRGARVRRAVRRARETGDVYFIDGLGS